MLEGKELVYKLGEYGEASLDVDQDLEITAEIAAKYKVSLKTVLAAYVAKTENKVDDKIYAAALGLLELLKAKA